MAGRVNFNKPNPIGLPQEELDTILKSMGGPGAEAQSSSSATPAAPPEPQKVTATSGPTTSPAWSLSTSDAKRLPHRELALITTQLSILCRSGLDLAQALKSLSRRVTQPKTRAALDHLHHDIESGLSFTEALRRQEGVFGSTFVATVAAGEASGRLSDVLTRLNALFRNDLRLRSAVRSVMTYPIVLLAVAAIVMAAMVFFVLPQFSRVFESMNRPAPLVTQCLLDVGAVSRGYWWAIIPTIVCGAFALWKLSQTGAFRSWRDRWLLTNRWSAPVTRHLYAGRIFRLLSTMLQSGVPLLDAIQLSRRTVANQWFQGLLKHLEEEIMAGRPLSPCLDRSICLPEGTADMIATAEAAGDLGGVLELVGEFYEEEGEQRLRSLVRVLEPVIIIVMGVLVSTIVLAIMLPLLDLSTGH